MKWKLLLAPLLGILLIACGGKGSKPTAAAPTYEPQKYNGTWKFNIDKTSAGISNLLRASSEGCVDDQDDLLTEQEISQNFRALLESIGLVGRMDNYLQVNVNISKAIFFNAESITVLPNADTNENIQPFEPAKIETIIFPLGTTLDDIRNGNVAIDWVMARNATIQLNQFMRNQTVDGANLNSLIRLTLNPLNHNELRLGYVSYQFINTNENVPPIVFYYDRIQSLDPAIFVESQVSAGPIGQVNEQDPRLPGELLHLETG